MGDPEADEQCGNTESITLRSLRSDLLRSRVIRQHNRVYHRNLNAPALHIPPEFDGVVV